MSHDIAPHMQVPEREWVSFPGGELEARRPHTLCPACREALHHVARLGEPPSLTLGGTKRPLCFQCYRAELDREHALKAAGEINTASVERFQDALPFEPVNHPRLQALKEERQAARVMLTQTTGGLVDRRRRAQIAARHALRRLADGLRLRQLSSSDRERAMASAVHAAELQLPESWMPFVVSH